VEAGSNRERTQGAGGEPLDKERSRICRKACDYIRRAKLRQGDATNLTLLTRPAIVLDTNVVLDWLLFADPSVARLAMAVESRQLRWIATAEMRDELAEVLRRGLADARGVDARPVLAAFDAFAAMLTEPQPVPRAARLICTDPDDQKFLDLAQTSGARWLLSRDRAVLKLARRAAGGGLTISTPEHWLPPE
jgi:predicted nucleic acid-binding protein